MLAALSGLDASFLGEAGELLLFVLPSTGLGGGGGLSAARRTYLEQLRRLTDDLEGTLDRLRRIS